MFVYDFSPNGKSYLKSEMFNKSEQDWDIFLNEAYKLTYFGKIYHYVYVLMI